MLVEGYKGQKVQDVKKPIQKMMVERVDQLILLVFSLILLNPKYHIVYQIVLVDLVVCVLENGLTDHPPGGSVVLRLI